MDAERGSFCSSVASAFSRLGLPMGASWLKLLPPPLLLRSLRLLRDPAVVATTPRCCSVPASSTATLTRLWTAAGRGAAGRERCGAAEGGGVISAVHAVNHSSPLGRSHKEPQAMARRICGPRLTEKSPASTGLHVPQKTSHMSAQREGPGACLLVSCFLGCMVLSRGTAPPSSLARSERAALHTTTVAPELPIHALQMGGGSSLISIALLRDMAMLASVNCASGGPSPRGGAGSTRRRRRAWRAAASPSPWRWSRA